MSIWKTLTRQQRTCCEAVAQGLDRNLVAKQLGISVITCRFHLQKAYAKLGVTNDSQLTHSAIKNNIITVK